MSSRVRTERQNTALAPVTRTHADTREPGPQPAAQSGQQLNDTKYYCDTSAIYIRLHRPVKTPVLHGPIMLSEGPKSCLSREGLELKFSRSISEPGHSRANMPLTLTPLMSPPSLTPTIHPPKRPRIGCRMEIGTGSVPSAGSGGFLAPSVTSTVSLPTSPLDSEGNTLQRTLVLNQTGTIDDDSLAKKLQKSADSKHGHRNFLLLDCRPFIAYNVSHIKGAINVNCCNRFNRKRLQQGTASLADLATTKEGKEALKKRNWKDIIVYDDGSEDLSCLPSSHTLFLVIKSLVEDLRSPVMLVGGIRCFQVKKEKLFLEQQPPVKVVDNFLFFRARHYHGV